MKLDIIYNTDCISEKGMKILPNDSIDMILADMPYGTTACKWDTIIPLQLMWEQLKRIVKSNRAIVLTASQPFTTMLIVSNMKMFKYCWVWDKGKAGNFAYAKKQPLRITEDIIVFNSNRYYPQMIIAKKENIRPRGKIYPYKEGLIQGMGSKHSKFHNEDLRYPRNVIHIKSTMNECNNINRIHPTQKPIALMEYLIKTYSNEGEVVLDFVIGSGTTAVACKRLNRHYIGFEINKEYCIMAKQRLEAEKTLWG